MNRFYFEPSSICQLACKLCPSQDFNSSRRGFMDYDKYKQLIEQSLSEGCMSEGDDVHLYGFGEPTLHHLLPEMIQLLFENNVTTKINTNGMAMGKKVWERLTDSGLTKCLVSLDGVGQDVYQQYRVGGNYQIVLNNLEYACQNSAKTEIEVQMIIFKHNAHQIDDFIKLVKNFGAHVATIKKARKWDGSKDNLKLDNIPVEYQRELSSPKCRFFDDFGVVLQDGSLTICTSDPFGKYTVGKIFDIGPSLWTSEQFKRLKSRRKALSICKFCGYDNLYIKKIKLRE